MFLWYFHNPAVSRRSAECRLAKQKMEMAGPLGVHVVSAFQLVPLSWHQMRNRMSSQRQVRPDNACATPDIGNTSRFVSLPSFDLRATQLPTLPHYPLHRFTILSQTEYNRVFITTSTHLLPFYFLPFLWRTMRPPMNPCSDCIGVFLGVNCHRVFLGYILFFFSPLRGLFGGNETFLLSRLMVWFGGRNITFAVIGRWWDL